MIKLTTNHGIIMLDLNAEKAPKTVANFHAYVEAGHYDNTVSVSYTHLVAAIRRCRWRAG